MTTAQGVTEELNRTPHMRVEQRINYDHHRLEEIILLDIISSEREQINR